MKRISLLFAALLLFSLLFTACAPQTVQDTSAQEASQATSTPEPIVVADATGAEVRLDAPAQKIVSLAPSNTEILFAVGAGQQVIARDDFSNYPAEAGDLPSIGGNMGDLNLEEIARLEPDLVLASPLTPPEGIQSLKEITPNVFVVPNPTNLDELYANLVAVGTLTGRVEEANQLVGSMKERAEAVLTKVSSVTDKPKVFYELDSTDPAKPWTAGPGTFVDLLISLAGGENVGASLSGEWAQISQEELIVQNPDIILLGDALYGGVTAEQVAGRPGWGDIAAVQANRVLEFNDDLVSRPGPRLVEGLEEMARVLHPELFE